MLNHVVNGIMRKKNNVSCSVGVIPFGTGNDFAGAGGIPVDFADALDIVIRARPLPIDVSQVNQTFFINDAVGGFPAEAVADTSRTTKKLLGKFAYLATGLANIANLDAKPVNFSAPGFEWQGSAYAFGLANGRQVGGGFEIAPKAVVNDGLFDLVIFPQTKAGLVTLIVDYSRLVRLGHPDRIIYRQVPWLNLTSRETIVLNLDGESIKGKSFRFRIHARRLPFCLPERSPLLNPLVQKNKFR
jgi:lipid kinase YegS